MAASAACDAVVPLDWVTALSRAADALGFAPRSSAFEAGEIGGAGFSAGAGACAAAAASFRDETVGVGAGAHAQPTCGSKRRREESRPSGDSSHRYRTHGDFAADVVSAFRRPGEYLTARAASGSSSCTPEALAHFHTLAERGCHMLSEWEVAWVNACVAIWDVLQRARVDGGAELQRAAPPAAVQLEGVGEVGED